VDNWRDHKHTCICQITQEDVLVVVGLLHGNNYHSETNFHPELSGYNTVTKAIIVTFHISQISSLTLARQGCMECLCVYTSSSFDANSPFNSLKYFTFDYRWQSFSMQMYSQAYSRNWSKLISPIAIFKSVNMKMWFQVPPRTPSDTGSTSDQKYVSTSIQVLLTDQVLPARIVRWSDSPKAQGNYL
jgi:hypothetical protein